VEQAVLGRRVRGQLLGMCDDACTNRVLHMYLKIGSVSGVTEGLELKAFSTYIGHVALETLHSKLVYIAYWH
jgi:hypothetical protein